MTTSSTPPTTPGEQRTESAADVSVGELLGNVSRDLSTLFRQELALAKAEVKTEATKASKGAGMLGGAGFAGYMVLLFLSFALWWALANAMDTGLAALLVAVVWAVIAAVLYVTGRQRLRQVNPTPQRTVDTVKQVPDTLKPTEERT
ncbi:phage holin family protein [Actinophytocola gossypii]|uniref:Phage holin family protein n=1 Tax=Actinophytocola gossypii TaxID=2812003 RepID=A0ABT2JA16_9PSEU|nr:phage holin family protein [Actinophytocola gossypii]MCT2584698.1 phage holin family protein [Actinophytocola gossypii]